MPEFRENTANSSSAQRRLLQAGAWLGLKSERSGWLFAVFSVLVTTMVATPFWFFVSHQNLMLLYVLSIVVTGLRHGAGPALLAACLGLVAHNFFFTVPHFDFGVPQDELASLVFLALIALACGPAASRIRKQFILLHQTNRHLEALRLLGQDLSVAEDVPEVWASTARELRSALQTESCIVLRAAEGGYASIPPEPRLTAADLDVVDWVLRHAQPAGRFTSNHSTCAWTVFPVVHNRQAIVAAAIRLDGSKDNLNPSDREMIIAMLQHAANTWGRIQLSGQLETARVQAEMEQLRSALLSSVSHDLKSPLSAIMGAAESLSVLDRQLPPEDRHELSSMILQESHRLDSYIQNLLDMTRLENGTLKMERDWVSVTDLIGSAIGRLKRYFPNAHIEFHTSDALPLLYINPALLEQALLNILENGVKFSPADEPIDITVNTADAFCQILVEDKGPGIPEHLREPIFDMFYVISEGDHKKPGTGMGLAICRAMVAAHGGRVWATAGRSGQGTCFVIELPVIYPESEGEEAELSEDRV